MHPYIKLETYWKEVTELTCSHPEVERIFQTGSTSADSSDARMFYNIDIVFKNWTDRNARGLPVRTQFSGENPSEVMKEAEMYLQSEK